jgi:hypothetical protein
MNHYMKTKGGREILRNNLAKFLFLRSNRLNGFVRDLVPYFILDVFLDAKSYTSGDEASTTLRRVLCELFVKSSENQLRRKRNDQRTAVEKRPLDYEHCQPGCGCRCCR